MEKLHKPSIVILASGGGSTAEAVIRATESGILDARVGLIICSRPPSEAGIYDRTADLNTEFDLDIPVRHISGHTHPKGARDKGEQTEAEAEAIAEAIAKERGGRFILTLLAGYLRKVHPLVFENEIVINTHRGPLPQTAGMYGSDIERYVLKNRLPYSEHVVHTVDGGYDTGLVIARHRVPVLPHHTVESLFEDVHAVEIRELPKDINDLLKINGLNNNTP